MQATVSTKCVKWGTVHLKLQTPCHLSLSCEVSILKKTTFWNHQGSLKSWSLWQFLWPLVRLVGSSNPAKHKNCWPKFCICCAKYSDFQIRSTASQTYLLLRSKAPCSPLSTACTLQPAGVPHCLVLFRLCPWHHRSGSTARSGLRGVTSWLPHRYISMPEVSQCHQKIQATVST